MPKINKKTESKIEKEEWSPSPAEKKAFKEMIEPFLMDKEATQVEWNGKMKDVPAHKGYKDIKGGQIRAMAAFEAVTLKEYLGRLTFAVRMEWSNKFIKTGEGVILYHKFQLLEKMYFRSLYGEQKRLEFYQENNQ